MPKTSERNRRSPAAQTVLALLAVLGLGTVTREPGRVAAARQRHERFDGPQQAQDFYAMKRVPVGETAIPVERYLTARKQMDGMARYSSNLRSFLSRTPDLPNIGTWSFLGPGNVGGRTRGLVIVPGSAPYTMYAGGVAGGVWKSTDGGASWAALDDTMGNLAIGALALYPFDFTNATVWAGTGEGYFNGDAVRGNGIFKTIDGGTTWNQISSTNNSNFHYVNDIAFSPQNPANVYAATRTGVWKSDDGGATWSRILDASLLTGGCLDLAIRTDQAVDYLFASCGTFTQARIYRWLDAENFPANVTIVKSEAGMGRTSIALAPSNEAVIYALSSSPSNYALHKVFRSTDGGTTWTVQYTNTGSTSVLSNLLLTNVYFAACLAQTYAQGWYDNVIAVDPTNSNKVWAGGVDLFRSDNGGATWGIVDNSLSFVHVDQHSIVFPSDYDGSTVKVAFVGNDGGLFRIDDTTAATSTTTSSVCSGLYNSFAFTNLNNGYGVTQFYYGVPYPDDSKYFGGTQDNGTVRGSDLGGPDAWASIRGGDGGSVAVDPTNTDVLYVENTGLSIQKSTNGGGSWSSAKSGITESGANFLFIAPFIMSPSNPQVLWTGGRTMWRTSDAAANWDAASAAFAASVSAIASAPSNGNFVLAGTTAGVIHRTSVGLTSGPGTVWSSVTPRSGYVSSLAFDPANANAAYATYSSFGGTHVFKSANAGASWTALDGPGVVGDPGHLPDIPAHSIVVDPSDGQRLYLGTDLGVFVSIDGGANWAVENTGFANVVTEILAVNNNKIYGFTHGRGAWRVPTTGGPVSRVSFDLASSNVAEAGGPASMTLTLTTTDANPSTSQVTVDYATGGGTATAGSDYTATSGTLTFALGTPTGTSQTIDVPITSDPTDELNETFAVTLSNVQGGFFGTKRTHTVTILDDDDPAISINDVTVTEGNSGTLNAVFTVSLDQPGIQTVTVAYTTANDTATAGSDYTTKAGALTFLPGTTGQTIVVPVIGDTLDESDETFFVNLSGETSATIADNQGLGTITDNDTGGTLYLTAPLYTVSEAVGLATVTVGRSGGAASGVTVGYTAAGGGTATAGSDFTAKSGTLSFAAGITAMSFTVPIFNDTLDEFDEGFFVAFSPPTGGASLGTQSVSTVKILDNDTAGVVQFSLASYSVSEGTALATIAVTRTGGAASGVTVNYATADGTATLLDTDYASASGTLSFGAGVTSKTFTVPITLDTRDESNETVNLSLNTPTGQATLGARSTATLTIVDNDTAGAISFSLASYTVGEGAGTATITVKRSGGLASGVTVNFNSVPGGTASDGPDYTGPIGTLGFGASETTKTFTVTIQQDPTPEGNETVNLTLFGPGGGATLGTTSAAVLTITDDDTPTVYFTSPTFTKSEAGGLATISVGRSGVLTAPATVAYTTGDNTATAGSDYTTKSGTLSFPAGVATMSFAVPILNDTLDEPINSETVNLTLSGPSGAALGTQATSTLNILDNDVGGVVQFSLSSYSVSEAAALATIAVTRTGGAASGVTVNYATADGTATLADNDYTSASGTLSFAAGVTSKTFTVPITLDTRDESNETVSLSLNTPTGQATLGARSTATLTIVDNDTAGAISFSLASYTVGEGAGTATITVKRGGGLASGATVNFATSDGTAAELGGDYTANLGVLSFGASETTKTFTVTVNEDGVAEGNETVNLTLSGPGGGATLAALLTIQDNDTPTVYFTSPTFTKSEAGGLATISVGRSGVLTAPATVAYTTGDNTATAGSDYTTKSGTLSFLAGVATMSFAVPILNDTLDEPINSETVNLTLSGPSGAALGTQATSTLNILDNDVGGVVQFSLSSYSVSEAAAQATIAVTRTGGAASGVTVNYATADGTATLADNDYTSASGTLSFGAGVTSRTFTVPITLDTRDESNETVNLSLNIPTGGATLGVRTAATLTITDNDTAGVVAFSAATYSIGEGGTATITVKRSGGLASGVTVNYEADEGTGSGDYVYTTGTLTFGANETIKTFTVTTLQDSLAEGNETANLTLTSPGGGATLGTLSAAVLTITDND